MKNSKFVIIASIALCLNITCSAQQVEKSDTIVAVDENKIEVLYFHYTRRCATCKAVASVSKEAVAELYGDNVIFAAYNLDETEGEARGDELDISGQTLIIVSDDKKINITNEGFMYARGNPEKLVTTIKEKVDSLM